MRSEISSRLIYMVEVLQILRDSGGVATSGDVYAALRVRGTARASDLETTLVYGETRFAKEVRFARNELADASLLVNRADGLWTLTQAGWATLLTVEDARSLVSRRRRGDLRRVQDAPFSEAGRAGPSRGPVPSEWTAIVERKIRDTAWTYVFRYGDFNLWKVGYSGNAESRLVALNLHVPFELTGERWEMFLVREWTDERVAYRMEQLLHTALTPHSSVRERFQCSEATIYEAWRSANHVAGIS